LSDQYLVVQRELIYDLLIPEQSKKHVDLLRQMEDNDMASSVNTTHSFRTLSDTAASVSDEYEDTDFSCRPGVRAYLKKEKSNLHYEREDGMELLQESVRWAEA
jgi:hypothetical protein